jgi:hypothetical protein
MACSRIANHQLAIRGNSVQHKNTIFHRIETLFSVLFSRRFQVPRRREVLPSSRITPLNACPALRPRWCPARSPEHGQDCGLPNTGFRRLSIRLPNLSFDHHYTFFAVQFRGLRPRLPSASHTASRRSHFGSATGLVASLWPGGIDRLTPTHPLGNNDKFQGVSSLFHRPELLSARPVIWLACIMVLTF